VLFYTVPARASTYQFVGLLDVTAPEGIVDLGPEWDTV
jgi:hypothetical protein